MIASREAATLADISSCILGKRVANTGYLLEDYFMERLVVLIPIVFGVALVAFGTFFIRLGLMARAFDRRIAAQGVDAQATITDHRQVHSDLRGHGVRDDYFITFRYTPKSPGQTPKELTTETEISSDDYDRLNPGDHVTARYLPDSPTEVILLDGVQEQTVPLFFKGGIGGLLVGVLMILLGIFAWLH
jgi:hypothetical protein